MKFFDTHEYLNIFVSKFWYEKISKYNRSQKIKTNEYPNIFFMENFTDFYQIALIFIMIFLDHWEMALIISKA